MVGDAKEQVAAKYGQLPDDLVKVRVRSIVSCPAQPQCSLPLSALWLMRLPKVWPAAGGQAADEYPSAVDSFHAHCRPLTQVHCLPKPRGQ